MKIEINAAQLDLILAGLNSLSEGAESEKRCCGNDPDIIETGLLYISDAADALSR